MSNNTVSLKKDIDVDWINHQFRQWVSSISVEFKLSVNCILALAHLWRQGRLDDNATVKAFEEVEQNAKRQRLLLEQLLDWRLTSYKLEGSKSEAIVNVVNQQYEQHQYSLAREYISHLDRILDLTYSWHQDCFVRSATAGVFEEIEYNAKRQSRILEKLLNWRLNVDEVNYDFVKPPRAPQRNQL
ncbi:hypothetical protein NUACC21_47930 [Scytonema sp. NUACC21]